MALPAIPPPALEVLFHDALQRDLTTARRAALLGILLHERYLTRAQLITRVEGRLGKGCFGASAWADVFYRDMRVVKTSLKAAGYRLGYSRSRGHPGYFLHGEPPVSAELAEIIRQSAAELDPAQMRIFRSMTPAQRFHLGSSATDAAINAVAYRIRQRRPDLSQTQATYLALQGRLPNE